MMMYYSEGVIVIAATNFPEMLDKYVLIPVLGFFSSLTS